MAHDTEKLRELLERVENATGPDRLLDLDCADVFGRLEAYSYSLDASIALVERMLPGHGWSVNDYSGVRASVGCFIHALGGECSHENGKTAPLAVLATLLRALISQAESSILRDGLTRAEAHKMEGGSGLSSCALQAEGEGAHREGVPKDVRKLVIAARNVAFDDAPSPEALKALDYASEAFAARVPWEDAS